MDKTIFCDDSIFGDPSVSPESQWSSAYIFSGEYKYCLCLSGEGQSWNRSWTKCAEQGRNCSCPGGIVRYVFGAPTSSTPTPTTTTPAPATTKNFSWGYVTNLWDCTFCPPGSQANTAKCLDGKRNDTTNETVKRDCTAIKNPKTDCKQKDDKQQCCICGTAQQPAGVRNYYPPAQTSCTM